MKMKYFSLLIIFLISFSRDYAQGTRILRQSTLHAEKIAFAYAGEIWISDFDGQKIQRLTSTPAVESNPNFSPDGKLIAFTSNRSGTNAVYVVAAEGGEPRRLTWHPSPAVVCGWTPDGKNILYSSGRETAPVENGRLWTVPVNGGPSVLLSAQWGKAGSFSKKGDQIVIEKISRWDVEWRGYRGGQNTPLIILDLSTQEEKLIPSERTTDILPVWLDETIYFLSDRDRVMNIWSYFPKTSELKQLTRFTGSDVKWLSGNGSSLAFERDGYLHLYDLKTGRIRQLKFEITGDFPWAETKWEDFGKRITAASLSPAGKRALFEARGEIYTVPVEYGDARNLTRSSGEADRAPVWSPKGDRIAWFSDKGGKGYSLLIASQDGLSEPKSLPIGESKLAWEPVWSPDGKYIAFDDDDVRIRVLNVENGEIRTIDTGGTNLERGSLGLTWSPDSKWLAYAKTGSNGFRNILVWSEKDNSIHQISNAMADAFSPSWDLDSTHFYFLAGTDLALGSGWANTSSIMAEPSYEAYVVNLKKEGQSPFKLRSDEEKVTEKKEPEKEKKTENTAVSENGGKKPDGKKELKKEDQDSTKNKVKTPKLMVIDFENIERRTIALPLPKRNYAFLEAGPKGTAFIGENVPNAPGLKIQKFTLEKREAKEYITGSGGVTFSADRNKMLARVNGEWKVMDADKASGSDGKSLKTELRTELNRGEEWKQMFEEAWRYERDYFYDPNLHGRDWDEVHKRYAPLVPFIKHRTDLTYLLDQVNGELSVGHSFVFGGDFPEVDRNTTGLLGADLIQENNRWKIGRIYTTESWNPELTSPLDQPGLKVETGNYLVGVNGKELTANDDPYEFLNGTAGRQTVLHLSKTKEFKDAWKETIVPISGESALRQRAWVEDNRRLVDSLSNGRLAYIWVPNTGGGGFISFNRYFFAQQDKQGAVIDERFNGGGLLDDYMVDLMTRSLRAALTNEVPNGKPLRLPAGILGPKVLLINEMAGSGGDFFPWVFRQQKAGPLIGARTWGGLVKSSVHYSLVDGGALTAPDNAVFDPLNKKWVAENEGVPPDIEVRQDAKSLAKGKDPQLERAVKELLQLVEKQGEIKIAHPDFPTPAKK